jgi:hypothetical protein
LPSVTTSGAIRIWISKTILCPSLSTPVNQCLFVQSMASLVKLSRKGPLPATSGFQMS